MQHLSSTTLCRKPAPLSNLVNVFDVYVCVTWYWTSPTIETMSYSGSSATSVRSTINIMTSRIVPSQADLNIDGSALLEVDKDENGWAQTYSCPQLVANNYVIPIALTYYYDLLFLSNENATKSRQYFESLLITTLAEEFGLSDGSACIAPSDTYILYPVMLSSLPEDEPNENLGELSCTFNLVGYSACRVCHISLDYFISKRHDFIQINALNYSLTRPRIASPTLEH